MTELTITPRLTPAGTIVELAGYADVSSSGRLVEALCSQLPPGAVKLIVDVADLAYMDSIALRALVVAAKVLKNRGGVLTVLHPREAVSRMLTQTGTDTLVLIQP
jgi:anti-sigma B factor antagonist